MTFFAKAFLSSDQLIQFGCTDSMTQLSISDWVVKTEIEAMRRIECGKKCGEKMWEKMQEKMWGKMW